MPRKATCRRSTKETRVSVTLDLDGNGDAAVATDGDVEVDDHHTVEDTALCVGEALGAALGDRTGIHRFGDARVPMDEAIGVATVDVGGRPYSVIDLELANPAIGNLTAQNIPHALEAFARSAGITMHLTATGRNDHQVAEAAFKALARALRAAVSPDPRRSGMPSTKGTPSQEGL